MQSIAIQSKAVEPARKRSRTVSSDVCNIESNSNSNSNSAWQHFDQHTMQPPSQILMTNDRVMTPRQQVASKPTLIVAPPMTFDQQTQTEVRNDTSGYLNHEVLSGQQTILAEQRLLRAELTTIAEKLDKFISGFEFTTDVQALSNGNTTTPRDIVVSSVSGADSSYTLINTSNQSEKPSENILHEDYNTSRFSFNDTNFSTTSSDPDAAATSSGAYKSGSSKNVSNSSRRSSTISLNIHSPTLHEMVRDNWNGAVDSQTAANFTICDAPQPPPSFKASLAPSESRTLSLGSNHTQIPAEILNSIDWSNYKAATRKLLVSLFDRNILANHSLTGKPSPAFVGRGKPMKNRLDPEKISDIIEAVMKYTGVQENLIRTAITVS
jgi:BEN domain